MTELFTKGEWIKGVAHWVENGTAMISVAFTWRLPEARRLAEYYQRLGYSVRAGGPGTFTQRKYLADVAEVGGDSSDAVARHNPMATFASRGCPVGCWFCIVPKMEGREFSLFPEFPVASALRQQSFRSFTRISRFYRRSLPKDRRSSFRCEQRL